MVAFDYGADITELAARGDGWLRTHAGHDGRADWLAAPGTCDITIDVPVDLLPTPDGLQPQASWLRAHGIDALVDEGRRTWEASAAIGDLTALKARSRIREADALLDPDGMGGYLVWEWRSSRPVPGVGSR